MSRKKAAKKRRHKTEAGKGIHEWSNGRFGFIENLRHRDTMQQERVAIDRLYELIDREVNMKNLFKKIMEQV